MSRRSGKVRAMCKNLVFRHFILERHQTGKAVNLNRRWTEPDMSCSDTERCKNGNMLRT